MKHQDQPINTAMITMLKACGFEVRLNTVSGQHQVEGTIENAAAFYKLTLAGADAVPALQANSTTSIGSLIYPSTLTADLGEVMGMPNFKCAPLAHGYRDAGLADIPRKAEAEQAFVIDRLVRLVIQHGADWRMHAAADLGKVRAALQAKKEGTA